MKPSPTILVALDPPPQPRMRNFHLIHFPEDPDPNYRKPLLLVAQGREDRQVAETAAKRQGGPVPATWEALPLAMVTKIAAELGGGTPLRLASWKRRKDGVVELVIWAQGGNDLRADPLVIPHEPRTAPVEIPPGMPAEVLVACDPEPPGLHNVYLLGGTVRVADLREALPEPAREILLRPHRHPLPEQESTGPTILIARTQEDATAFDAYLRELGFDVPDHWRAMPTGAVLGMAAVYGQKFGMSRPLQVVTVDSRGSKAEQD